MDNVYESLGKIFADARRRQMEATEAMLRAKLKDIEANRKKQSKVFVMDRLRRDLDTPQKMMAFSFLYNLNNAIDIDPVKSIIREL
jgi:hypothetical protein